ncbi:hypothetical protein SCARD494_10236, partial [Seiridium cardinale]
RTLLPPVPTPSKATSSRSLPRARPRHLHTRRKADRAGRTGPRSRAAYKTYAQGSKRLGLGWELTGIRVWSGQKTA